MEIREDKNSYSEFEFPQLSRFNPTKFSVEQLVPSAGRKLESRVSETVQFVLESAPAEVAETLKPNERVRISVILTLEANWRDKEKELAVATFSGVYRALFNFVNDMDEKTLQAQMRVKSFRDYLAVQIYPVARSHMISQVGLIGISVKQRLGLNVYAESITEEMAIAAPPKKRSRKSAAKVISS